MARRNKSSPDGPGNCGRGKEVCLGGQLERGPGVSWDRQSSWPPAALCSWLSNVLGLPGDGLAPAAPIPHHQPKQAPTSGVLKLPPACHPYGLPPWNPDTPTPQVCPHSPPPVADEAQARPGGREETDLCREAVRKQR